MRPGRNCTYLSSARENQIQSSQSWSPRYSWGQGPVHTHGPSHQMTLLWGHSRQGLWWTCSCTEWSNILMENRCFFSFKKMIDSYKLDIVQGKMLSPLMTWSNYSGSWSMSRWGRAQDPASLAWSSTLHQLSPVLYPQLENTSRQKSGTGWTEMIWIQPFMVSGVFNGQN